MTDGTTHRVDHDVVVVGGGNAGIALCARLLRDGCRDVALVEPSQVHRYRPLLSFVGAGQARSSDVERPMRTVVPDGVRWYADRAVSVDAGARSVQLGDTTVLGYGDLVLCPGSEVDWAAVPGARAAVATPHATTNYESDHASGTWPMLSGLTAGRAVFTMSQWQVPCAGVALKPLFAATEHWRRTWVLDQIEVDLLVEGDRLLPHDGAEAHLREAAASYGVRIRLRSRVTAVDAVARQVVVGDEAERIDYDVLHLTPPHRAPTWLSDSGLGAGPGGFVPADPRTLQHPAHPEVWALGDVADLATTPSGGALRSQVPVVAANIQARRRDAALTEYDGYTVAPVLVSAERLLLAEFDRDGAVSGTAPFVDLARPRRSTYLFDRHLQPQVYWHWLLRGR